MRLNISIPHVSFTVRIHQGGNYAIALLFEIFRTPQLQIKKARATALATQV